MTDFEIKAKALCENIILHYETDAIYISDPFEYCYKMAKATLEAIPLGAEVLKKIAVEYKDGWIILLKQGDITISYPKSDVKQFIEDLSRALNGERLSTLH